MSWLKPLEVAAKLLLAVVAAALLWRPGRRAGARARLASARKVLVVRIDNRVGEALLTTPAFEALKARPNPPRVYALVHAKAARVLEGHPALDGVIAFERRGLFAGPLAPGIAALRAQGFDAVVNCASWAEASVTAALVSRLAGPRAAVVGPLVFPSGWLCDVPVEPLPGTRSEVLQRRHLVSPLAPEAGPARMSFRPPRQSEAVKALLAGLPRPFAVVNPGGRLGFRRVPAAVFAAAARALGQRGIATLVTWGPQEDALAQQVVAGAPHARLAPATDLDELACLLRAARLSVVNNTGPMHLSVAVGTPTLSLFLKMEVARWSHGAPPHALVDLTPLAERPQEMERAVTEAVDSMVASLQKVA